MDNKIKVLIGKRIKEGVEGWEWFLTLNVIMSAEERLLEYGYEGVKYLTNYSYDDALIGVSEDGRAVYDFDKMVEWLMEEEDWTDAEAIEWIECNTLRALPYFGEGAPIIMYSLPTE